MSVYYKDSDGKMRVVFGNMPEPVKWAWANRTRDMSDEEARGFLPSIGVTGSIEYVYVYRDAYGDQRGWGYIAENGEEVDLSMYDDEMIKHYKESWDNARID